MRVLPRVILVAGCWSLVAGLTGCESLQRKFTRKPSQEASHPTPIINFQDYTQAMTPLDRYRKHYLMFDYWNDDLLRALESPPLNPKRLAHASSEALDELKTIQSLLSEDVAARLAPLIEERTKVNRRLLGTTFPESDASLVSRIMEAQTRRIHREFSWRDMAEQLKAAPVSAQPGEPVASTP